jgi:hypothetical protein
MPKPQSHGTGLRLPREYSGAEVAQPLLDWLNQPQKDRGRQRVREILEIFKHLQKGWTVERTEDKVHAYYKGEDHTRSLERLQKLLREYKYYPMFFPLGSITGSHWYPVPQVKKYSHGWGVNYDDSNAIFDLADLADTELLNRLKECRCGRWIFAKFSHQRFCSVQCREKEFRSSPEWKEYRRKKARGYYRLHKSGKVK